jgi:serine/threonine protein kinase
LVSTRRFDRYEVLETLESQQVLAQYLTRDSETGKTMVLETLAAELFPTRRRAEEWLTQARSLRRFRHANLVPVVDFGRLGCFYIVREWAPGMNLAELQAGEWKFEAVQTAQIGASVAEALAYLHRNGRLHGAVSPRNVILGTEGEIRLTGLGSVLMPEPEALEFVAPELQRGEKPHRSADLYSLGALMGALHRAGGSWESEAPEPRSPSAVRDPLAALISTLTAEDPAKRPQSAGAIAETLHAMVRQALPPSERCEDEVLELADLPSEWSVPFVNHVASPGQQTEGPVAPDAGRSDPCKPARRWRFWGAALGAVLLGLTPVSANDRANTPLQGAGLARRVVVGWTRSALPFGTRSFGHWR